MKLSLSMPWRRSRDIAPFIVYFSTRWGKWSTSHPDRFAPRNKPMTHWRKGWTGPSVGLDVTKKRRISENYSEGFQRLYEMSQLMFVCCDCCSCFCCCCFCFCCCCSCRCYFLLIRLVLLFRWPWIWNYYVITQVPIMLKCFQFSNFKRSSELRYRHTVVLYNQIKSVMFRKRQRIRM